MIVPSPTNLSAHVRTVRLSEGGPDEQAKDLPSGR